MPLSDTEQRIFDDFIEEVRALAIQLVKIWVELKTLRMVLVGKLLITEDELLALISAVDVSSAGEMNPDRPSVAGFDSARRRLVEVGSGRRRRRRRT